MKEGKVTLLGGEGSAEDGPKHVTVRACITHFRGEHYFLSNFAPAAVRSIIIGADGTYLQGPLVSTVEHAFQMAKCVFPNDAHIVRMSPSARIAKNRGRQMRLRSDWERIKVSVMRTLLREKFKHESFRIRLLATGDAELVEGNAWGDRFWGRCADGGQNWLGRLLMEVRAELQGKVKP